MCTSTAIDVNNSLIGLGGVVVLFDAVKKLGEHVELRYLVHIFREKLRNISVLTLCDKIA